jgi:hypothetical protein
MLRLNVRNPDDKHRCAEFVLQNAKAAAYRGLRSVQSPAGGVRLPSSETATSVSISSMRSVCPPTCRPARATGFGQAGVATDTRVELRTALSSEVTDLARRGETMLGLRYFRADRSELVSLDAGHEPVLVIAAAGHGLAKRQVRDPRALSDERWIVAIVSLPGMCSLSS